METKIKEKKYILKYGSRYIGTFEGINKKDKNLFINCAKKKVGCSITTNTGIFFINTFNLTYFTFEKMGSVSKEDVEDMQKVKDFYKDVLQNE